MSVVPVWAYKKWLYCDCGNVRLEQISLAYPVENLSARVELCCVWPE